METLLKLLVSNGLVRARIKAGISAASLFAGGWVLSHMLDWVEAHLTFLSHADAMALASTVAASVAALVLAVGTAIYNTWVDPSNVNAKVIAVAATGDPATANDVKTVAEVKAVAGTPQALSDLVAKLQMGKV